MGKWIHTKSTRCAAHHRLICLCDDSFVLFPVIAGSTGTEAPSGAPSTAFSSPLLTAEITPQLTFPLQHAGLSSPLLQDRIRKLPDASEPPPHLHPSHLSCAIWRGYLGCSADNTEPCRGYTGAGHSPLVAALDSHSPVVPALMSPRHLGPDFHFPPRTLFVYCPAGDCTDLGPQLWTVQGISPQAQDALRSNSCDAFPRSKGLQARSTARGRKPPRPALPQRPT